MGHLDPLDRSRARRDPQLRRSVRPPGVARLALVYHGVRSAFPPSHTHTQASNIFLPSPRLLLFGSGVPTAEKPVAQRFYKMAYPDDDSESGNDFGERQPANAAWANYPAYRAQTSILLPLPPAVYRALPVWLKRTLLLELPMYEWTPGSK